MTSAHQMSSRKPPVRQSTFGFPDDPPGFGLRPSSAAFRPARPARRLPQNVPRAPESCQPAETPVCAPKCGYVRLIPKKIICPNVDSSPPLAHRKSKIPNTASVPPPAFVSVLSNFQNVEKLSFQARVLAFSRESDDFFPVNIRAILSRFQHFARSSRLRFSLLSFCRLSPPVDCLTNLRRSSPALKPRKMNPRFA